LDSGILLNASSLAYKVSNGSGITSEYIAQVCYLPNLTVERMLVLILGLWLVAQIVSMMFYFSGIKSSWRVYIESYVHDIASFAAPIASFVALVVLYWHDSLGFMNRNRLLYLLFGLFLILFVIMILVRGWCWWEKRNKKEGVSEGEKSGIVQDDK
jgi:hypothetical protein